MTTAQVSGYTRKDGTRVSPYSQGRQTAMPGRHASVKGRAQLVGAGGLLFVGSVQMLSAVMNVVTAVLTVLAGSLLAWGGYKGARRKRRRAAGGLRRRVALHGWSRSRSPAQWQALTDRKQRLRDQRWRRRDEVWGRRRQAVAMGWQTWRASRRGRL